MHAWHQNRDDWKGSPDAGGGRQMVDADWLAARPQKPCGCTHGECPDCPEDALVDLGEFGDGGTKVQITHTEREEYENQIVALEALVIRLKRLVLQPSDRGGYVGDTYCPVGGVEASHRWNGEHWEWLPEFDAVRPCPVASR